MALWDNLFKKKDESSAKLNPIVQKSPPPAAAPRVSHAKPVPKPASVAPPPPSAPPRKPESGTKLRQKSELRLPNAAQEKIPASTPVPRAAERETKSRKKSGESNTKGRLRPTDEAGFMKRGLARQSQGDHDGAIEDFSKAIELNPNLAQAYASRGVSKEAKGDGGGAKSDYSKSIQIEIMTEINRQMNQNPDVEM